MTDKKLPPDADGQNDDRAEAAETAVAAYRQTQKTDLEDALCDLLCDLQHWADRNDMNFAHELERGNGHYWSETQTEGGW